MTGNVSAVTVKVVYVRHGFSCANYADAANGGGGDWRDPYLLVSVNALVLYRYGS